MKALKILFADDDLKYSMLLKRFLEKEGYEVTYAGNGKIALEQFPLIKPDLVLLDINMPGYNGFEVAERIREMDKHVLIFFLSDRSDKNDRLKGFSLKGNDYLAKPFYPEELLARKASSQSWAASASFSWLKLGSPGYFSTNFLMSASLGSRLMVAL